MQEPTFLILTVLADEARHGYAIAQEVAALSNGRVALRTGTLYAALDRLLAQGLIAVSREEVVDGRHRRYYSLSDAGAESLTDEAERLRRNATEARRRLRTRAHVRFA
jgi:DNA-binding PadR family transcriptional regulator